MVKGRRQQRAGENASQRREANVEAGEQKVDGGVSWSRQVGVEIDGSSETERRTEGEALQSETSGDISIMMLR